MRQCRYTFVAKNRRFAKVLIMENRGFRERLVNNSRVECFTVSSLKREF